MPSHSDFRDESPNVHQNFLLGKMVRSIGESGSEGEVSTSPPSDFEKMNELLRDDEVTTVKRNRNCNSQDNQPNVENNEDNDDVKVTKQVKKKKKKVYRKSHEK